MEIKTLECSPKDTIVIQFKIMEDYTFDEIAKFCENLQSAVPNPIVFVPKGMIEDITVISSHPKYLEMVECGRPAPEYSFPFSSPSTGGKELW